MVSDFQSKPNIICYSRAPWLYASRLLQIILPPICERLCDTGGLACLECGIPSAVTAPLWQIVLLLFIYSGCCFVAVKWNWHDKVRVKLLCWANFITSVHYTSDAACIDWWLIETRKGNMAFIVGQVVQCCSSRWLKLEHQTAPLWVTVGLETACTCWDPLQPFTKKYHQIAQSARCVDPYQVTTWEHYLSTRPLLLTCSYASTGRAIKS